MTEVIYARVPETLKAAADQYAANKGATLTAAVVDLMERGLAAAMDGPSIAALQASLAQARAERAQIVADLNAARAEVAALSALTQRAQRQVGTCPNPACARPITGLDLLGAGACSACGRPLSSLIVPAGNGSPLDQREVLMLLGALGAVLAVAYIASK